MASLREIRRRITSVRSTQKITRAMKMVAAAKLRRAQDAIAQTRPYTSHMRELVAHLTQRSETTHPLLEDQPGSNGVTLIAITADRGLCGAHNAGLIQEATALPATQFTGREMDITVIGRKGVEGFRRRGIAVAKTYMNIVEEQPAQVAREISRRFIARYMNGETGAVYCLYNQFRSAIAQQVYLERLLPLDLAAEPCGKPMDYVYEPSPSEVLDRLLRTFLRVQVQRILREAAASEHGARMTAMDSATNNASDVIERLTLQYNRLRQDAITKEVIEVVSGAEAL